MSDRSDIKALSETYLGMLNERKKMGMDDAIMDVLDNEKIGKNLDKTKRPRPQQMVQLIDLVAKKMALNPRSLDPDKEDEIREKILLYMNINEQLDEAKDMEGKDYTFVATVRGMSNARKKASEYSNARIVQIDSDFYGVIVPTK